MKARLVLDPSRVHPAAAADMHDFNAEAVREVADAIEGHRVVVVGMAQNPHVRNVRRALTEAGIAFHYLEYGSYFSQWKRRLAIKLWSGWPTFPQVFVDGVLFGGEDRTKAALADGTLSSKAAGAASARPRASAS